MLVFLALVLVCGIYDYLRNGLYDIPTFKKYFVGNGRNTWLLAPFNTLFDLLSSRNVIFIRCATCRRPGRKTCNR
jgi:beta-hydroxylase